MWPVGGDQNHLTKQSSKLALQFWGRNEGTKGKAKPPRLPWAPPTEEEVLPSGPQGGELPGSSWDNPV